MINVNILGLLSFKVEFCYYSISTSAKEVRQHLSLHLSDSKITQKDMNFNDIFFLGGGGGKDN